MNTSLDHLSPRRAVALERARDIMLEELQARIEKQDSARARRYRLLKLILFGPITRTAEPATRSGMNLLVIVSHRALAEKSAFWEEVEDRIAYDREIGCPVTLVIHTLPDVNRRLREGAYFFTEIIRQGVLVYEDGEPGKDGRPKNILAKPIPPDSQRAFKAGLENYYYWKRTTEQFLIVGKRGLQAGPDWRNNTAFQLNQAAENTYRMFLLTVTQYAPASHHLGKLRSLARAIDPRIDEAWAVLQKPYDRHFELLQRAYVEARYSPAYETDADILAWQADRIEVLISVADALCLEHLNRLKAGSGKQNCMSSRTLVSGGDDR